MRMYPIFLSLASFSVLVVGAGTVGCRKISALCKAGVGGVRVLDPALPSERARRLEAMGPVRVEARTFSEQDLAGILLAFAVTNDSKENARIASICARMNVPCNVADAPEKGSFILPSVAVAGSVTAAFSTGGQSPALAARIKEDAASWLQQYDAAAVFLGRLRPLVLGLRLSVDDKAAIFRALVQSRFWEALCEGDTQRARTIVSAILPPALHDHIGELLYGGG